MTNGDLHLRIANLDDAAAVTSLLCASYTSLMADWYEASVLARALPIMTQANRQLLASGNYYVVWVNDQCVGCGGWALNLPDSDAVEPGIAHIRHFATHPDWTRRGIARAIIARCFTDAKFKSVKQFDCFAALGSEHFYQRMGFAKVAPIEISLPGKISLPATLTRYEIG